MASVRDPFDKTPRNLLDSVLDFGAETPEEKQHFSDRVEKLRKKLAELRTRIDRLSEPVE